MKIYNTLTKQKEPFLPRKEGEVKMYVCGPTVYAEAHIGHGMSAVVFDIIRRYLEYKGYKVDHVSNFTDVDDKIIDVALKTGRSFSQVTEPLIEAYSEQLKKLNVEPSRFAKATDEIAQIIDFITKLIERKAAYVAENDVFFRVNSFTSYGSLANRRLAEQEQGVRFAVDERKENPNDFALWKAAKGGGEPALEKPLGSRQTRLAYRMFSDVSTSLGNANRYTWRRQ